MRDLLPKEIKRTLAFDELVSTIDLVVGETVCVGVEGVMAAPTSRTLFQASGELRRLDLSWAPAFAVGALFTLVLDEVDFVAADLRTLDGNSFFLIGMQFGSVRLVLGTFDEMGSDYEADALGMFESPPGGASTGAGAEPR